MPNARDKRAQFLNGKRIDYVVSRDNHTGTQAQSTVDGLESALAAIESGKVEISATPPVANQITIWEDPSTVAGDPNFTWDGSICTVVGAVAVTDEVYGAGWDSSTEVPTKNALYDKIETIVASTYTDEQAQDAVGTILTDSSEIDFTYNDVGNTITATLITGSIDVLKLDPDVQTSLGLADTASQPGHAHVVADISFNGSVIPTTTGLSLGTQGVPWGPVYANNLRAQENPANTLLIQAYDTDGESWTTFITLTSNTTPTCDLASSVTLGGSAISVAGHTHAASDITSGTFDNARIAQSNVTQHVAAIDHDQLLNFTANEHIDWTAASVAFVTSSTITADDLILYDADASHTLTIHWNENEATLSRTLNISMNGGSRFINMQGDLTVSDAASIEGTNTGDQTITLTGDVTGSGTGSFAATIANDAVTFAKMQNISTDRFLARYNTGSGDVEEARFDGSTLAMSGSGVVSVVTGGIGDTHIRDATALSVIGRAANSTGDVADIAASADGDILRRDGTTLGFGKITTNSISTVDVADETADHGVISGDEGTLFTDAGASSMITLTLPSPTDGMYFEFAVVDGSGLRIKALSGDVIYVGDEATSDGGAISSTTIGSYIRLVGKGLNWFASYHSGQWSELPNDSMLLRFEADDLFNFYNDGDSVAVWRDLSGNQNNGYQGTAASQPVLNKGGGGNGHHSVTFDGSDDRINMIDFSAESLTAAEAFLVVKIDTDPPGSIAQAGLWEIGSDASANLYPFTDGVIYDGFGSTARKTTVNPTPTLTSWRIYSVYSASSDWQNYLDGTSLYSTATNTVGFFSGAATLGEANGGYNLDGDISEFIVYSKKLSTNERADAIAYLKTKYGIA